MVIPTAGEVVLVPFPYSDLSQSKLRPAVVLAKTNRDDWVLCQITSKPYGDPLAIPLLNASFTAGSMRVSSFARLGKLFTAHRSLMVSQIGSLNSSALKQIVNAVISILRPSQPGRRR